MRRRFIYLIVTVIIVATIGVTSADDEFAIHDLDDPLDCSIARYEFDEGLEIYEAPSYSAERINTVQKLSPYVAARDLTGAWLYIFFFLEEDLRGGWVPWAQVVVPVEDYNQLCVGSNGVVPDTPNLSYDESAAITSEQPSVTNTPTSTSVPTSQPSPTAVPPTAMPSSPTQVPPSVTPVLPTATNTSVPPTKTFTPVPPSATAVPTATNLPKPTQTNTPVPPRPTNTPVPRVTNTPVPRPTNTPVTPTATEPGGGTEFTPTPIRPGAPPTFFAPPLD